MKRKIMIFRFGSPTPTIGDFDVINHITDGERTAVGTSTPVGSLSMVLTSYTAHEIVKLYSEASARHEDSLPVIVVDCSSDSAGFDFHPGMFGQFESLNEAFESEYGAQLKAVKCTLSLDELLDLVKQKGVKNLSTEELKRLQDLSQGF